MTFAEKELGKPFTVYVVFEDICGLLREYTCVITPHTFLGIKLSNKVRVRIYHEYKESGYYFELHNKADYYCLDHTRLFLKGDGTDRHYAHGSFKSVFLDKRDAIECAKSEIISAKNNVRYASEELRAFQIKEREGCTNIKINDVDYTIHLGKNSFTVNEIPDVSFNYDDCKAPNGVVVLYKIIELIKNYLNK